MPIEETVILDTKRTALVAAAAVAVWSALFLLIMQVAYSYGLDRLLEWDFEALVVALAGLGITLLFIFSRSAAPHQDKVTIGVVSLISLYGISFVGGLSIACANGNCL